jgi:hypothetical protein
MNRCFLPKGGPIGLAADCKNVKPLHKVILMAVQFSHPILCLQPDAHTAALAQKAPLHAAREIVNIHHGVPPTGVREEIRRAQLEKPNQIELFSCFNQPRFVLSTDNQAMNIGEALIKGCPNTGGQAAHRCRQHIHFAREIEFFTRFLLHGQIDLVRACDNKGGTTDLLEGPPNL